MASEPRYDYWTEFRYVGKEAALKMHEENWTLEEYCLYEGVLPKLKENQ